MPNSLGQYIESLMSQDGLSQSNLAREIGVPRQLLSYVIRGKREMSLQLAMKLECYFSLPDGELMKMQALHSVRCRKLEVRNALCEKLLLKNAFWSYDVHSSDAIPDEELIEKCFVVLDIDDINLMFELYPRKYIRKVWQERMAIQGEYMYMLNVMIAMYYFGIKEPEKYLAKVERNYMKNLFKDASGINS